MKGCIQLLLGENRSATEVQGALFDYERAFKEVSDKHDCYAESIADDEAFEKEACWMEECHETHLNLQIKVRDFLESLTSITSEVTPREPEPQPESNPEPEPTVRSRYKIEMPKLPCFIGEAVKTDFLHMVDGR